jgi:hypothetical protein
MYMLSDTEFKPILVSDDEVDGDAVLDDDALPEAVDPLEEEDGMGWESKGGMSDDDTE